MREHKYQAWHKTEKKMDEVTELCTWRKLVYVSKEMNSWTFNECELRQYTGLKDSQGHEIYEGDIIRGTYDYGSFGNPDEAVIYAHGTWNYSYAIQETGEKPERDWTVIGNIYEHLELLGEKR